MSSSIRRLALFATGVFVLITTSACAVYAQTGRTLPPGASRAEFEHGYRNGLSAGDTDARRGERFNFTDERDWQRARGDYAFREGFERGYADGYRRGGYVGQGGYGGYGGRGNGGYGGRGGIYANPATARGFEEGYKQGVEDARDRDRYDPIRAKDYRKGDNGYDRRFGTRDQWKI